MQPLRRGLLVLGFGMCLLAGCSSGSADSQSKTQPATASAADPSAREMMDVGREGLSKLQEMAAKEEADAAARLATLERLIEEVESLILAGDLDKAEIRAAGVQWHPDPTRSQISDSDKRLIKQFDERRATLMDVIARKRGQAL